METILKKVLYRLLRIFHFRWIFHLCRRVLFDYVTIEMIRDWGKPQKPFFFKKEADLYGWYYNAPKKGVEWIEQGVYPRQAMTKGCKVLDLCCGDGFFPYMFYSDFASRVDALDFDRDAITHANTNYAAPNVHFHQSNIITDEFPNNQYDVVIWNTAMDYFSHEQQEIVFTKIMKAAKSDFIFFGSVPKVEEGSLKHSDNHVKHFSSYSQLEEVLKKWFKEIVIFHTDYNHRSTFYFKCKQPIIPA